MMQTPYGTLVVGDNEALFRATVEAIEEVAQACERPLVGLTGGSTPKVFYKWVVQTRPFSQAVLERVIWSTSDERCVPLESGESNFGEAQRGMLRPLGIPEANQRPWAVQCEPYEAAARFNAQWEAEGRKSAFDLCLLGMGEDAHTASLFPGSVLLREDQEAFFAAVEVPGKGWRLTLTPKGLLSCKKIIVTATGAAKATTLREVFWSEPDPLKRPVQCLAGVAERTRWFLNEVPARVC